METIGRDLREMYRVPLQPAHITAIRAAGTHTHYPKGAMLAEIGAAADPFVYVEHGKIEVVNPFTGDRLVPSTLGPTQFMSEISPLSGGTWSLRMRAASVDVVPRHGMVMKTFMLAAKHRGSDTCAQGAWNLFWSATRRIFSIPEDEYIVAGMALGYADPDDPVNRVIAPREPLDQIATFHA